MVLKTKSSGTTKLTEYQAIAVCELANKGVDHDEIAALFGIKPLSVRAIKNGRAWFNETLEVRRKYQGKGAVGKCQNE